MKMMGIDILEHTERQLAIEEARQLYASMLEQVFQCQLILLLSLLLTVLAWEIMQSPQSICPFVRVSVRLSICFHSIFGTD